MSKTETTHNPTIEHLQKLHRRRMAIFGLVILIAGLVIGAASALIIAPGKVMQPPRPPEWMIGPIIDSIDRDLGLSPEQKNQIKPIVETHMEKMGQIMEEGREKFYALWNDFNSRIAATLTEEQAKMWNRKLEEVQHRMRSRRRRGSGDPNRPHRGPGPSWRPDDPNRSRNGFGPGRWPGDPNRPRTGFGRDSSSDRYRRGPGRRPGDSNFPRGGFDRDQSQERFRRSSESYRPKRPPADSNDPGIDANQPPTIKDE